MGVLSSILLWPLAPVRAVVSLGEVVQRRVEEELANPVAARRELEDAEAAHRDGQISADELRRIQQDVLDRLRGLPSGGLELTQAPRKDEG